MPSNHFSTSTDRPGASSVGASNLACTPPWDPRNQSPSEVESFQIQIEPDSLFWVNPGLQHTIGHMVVFSPERGTQAYHSTSLQQRLICYALVDHLPDEAMEETIRVLVDIDEDYYEPPAQIPLLRATEKRLTGEVSKIVERQTFDLELE